MLSAFIVKVYVLCDSKKQFQITVIPVYVDLLILQGAPESLYHYIICCTAFPIHTQANAISEHAAGVCIRGELPSLIGIDNLRLAMQRYCFL